MATRTLFATQLYETELGDEALLGDLAHSIRSLAAYDSAGRRWSREKGYRGYTSYASLDDLHLRDPAFAELKKWLARHAAAFAEELCFQRGRKLRLDSLWVNLLRGGGHHSAHIHPHSVLSGTLYVDISEGAGAIRFEDPRLGLMMAAPARREDAPDQFRPFVEIKPRRGLLLLWESWLRHEVLPGPGKAERLSISFNFA